MFFYCISLVGGCIGFVIFSSAALVFWYGVKLIQDENTDPGAVIAVFINILLGSIFLGNALPNVPYILGAVTASKEIFATINNASSINKNEVGKIVPNFNGSVTFHHVNFTYPTRPDIPVSLLLSLIKYWKFITNNHIMTY
ncbi:unnamed protein product [Trichobilharzia regenti]|nr:unnamed protein product [Trichobilharzia regenti]